MMGQKLGRKKRRRLSADDVLRSEPEAPPEVVTLHTDQPHDTSSDPGASSDPGDTQTPAAPPHDSVAEEEKNDISSETAKDELEHILATSNFDNSKEGTPFSKSWWRQCQTVIDHSQVFESFLKKVHDMNIQVYEAMEEYRSKHSSERNDDISKWTVFSVSRVVSDFLYATYFGDKKEAIQNAKKQRDILIEYNVSEGLSSTAGSKVDLLMKLRDYLTEEIPVWESRRKEVYYDKFIAILKEWVETTEKETTATNPYRLGLEYFYGFYHFLYNPNNACDVLKKAFDEAIAQLDTLNDTDYRQSVLVMQIIRDVLTVSTDPEMFDSQLLSGFYSDNSSDMALRELQVEVTNFVIEFGDFLPKDVAVIVARYVV